MEPTPSCHRHKILFIVILAFAIILGNALAGLFVASGIYHWRLADRCVSVKGIAERQANAAEA